MSMEKLAELLKENEDARDMFDQLMQVIALVSHYRDMGLDPSLMETKPGPVTTINELLNDFDPDEILSMDISDVAGRETAREDFDPDIDFGPDGDSAENIVRLMTIASIAMKIGTGEKVLL